MSEIWVYSEDITITKQLLTLAGDLAQKSGRKVSAITLAEDKAVELGQCGADTVYLIKDNSLWPESYAKTIADLTAKYQPELFLIGGTLRGKDLAAKVAASVQTGLVSDAFSVRIGSDGFETDRLMYGGLVISTELLSKGCLVTVPARLFDPMQVDSSLSAEIVKIEAINDNRLSIGEVHPIVHEGADIGTADKVVGFGRGVGKQEDIKLIEALADALGAEVGCTRPIAEDAQWLPMERYIGISGQKITPSFYLTVGISGQVQHIAGVRDSKLIVAIDINENAPIFAAADYGIVGDYVKIVPALISAIQKAK